jgi:hypothetical protein
MVSEKNSKKPQDDMQNVVIIEMLPIACPGESLIMEVSPAVHYEEL